MAQFVIPANENSSQQAIDLYLSVFDTTSVDNRMAILKGAGVHTAPTTKARALGLRSLTWATAAEVGLRALATAGDPDTLATADAVVAALRVARGLAEDRRSVNDPLIDELLSAASTLTAPRTSEGLATLHAECLVYRNALRSGTCSPNDYLDSLRTHSNGVTGALLREMHLVDPEVTDEVYDFTVSLGVLYQLTTDLRAATDGTLRESSISRTISMALLAADDTRDQVTDVIVTRSRLLLQTTKSIQSHYARNSMLDEITLRANITLRECAVLLKQEQARRALDSTTSE
ncbi:hypothetical protein [Rhodococcus sp. Q]|uniref:hypothetical protein n=1 Tax=Rhodococcus sp. Q TaxID=2502252 RepID=UPI0010F9995D|nr:hypothetical protein [Rhodococcus sp. Q]